MIISYIEGSFATVMLAMAEAFYIPYINAMGASSLQIGLAVSLPAIASALVQVYTPATLNRVGSRKKLVVLTTIIQALCFIPMGLVCQTNWDRRIWLAIAFFVIASGSMNLGSGSWADWMAHIVPSRRHGRYFATRNQILGLIQMAMALAAGFFLDKSHSKTLLMFTFIWLICFASRMVSSALQAITYAPRATDRQKPAIISFRKFLRQSAGTGFGRFTLAVALLSFGVNFATPFFAVHMLNNLKFSYMQYTTLIVTVTATIIVALGFWGRIIDRIGAVIPTRICALLIAVAPLPWVLTDNYLLLFLAQLLAGFCWAGFNLSVFVYFIRPGGQLPRIIGVSYYNAINFFFVFAGATLGGVLGPHLPTIAKHQLQSVFLASILMRFVPVAILYLITIEKYPIRVKILQRLFFNPTLNLRTGITRSILGFFKHDI